MANKKVSEVEDAYLDKMLVEWIKADNFQQVYDFFNGFIKARLPDLKTTRVLGHVAGVPIYEHDLTAPEGIRAIVVKRLKAAQPPVLPAKT